MSLRINKRIGFGLNDILLKDGKIVDPRINTSPFHSQDETSDAEKKEPGKLWNLTGGQYFDFLKEKNESFDSKSQDRAERKKYEEFSLLNFNPHYSSQFMSKRGNDFITLLEEEDAIDDTTGILLLQPLSLSVDWTHHNDALDYYSMLVEGEEPFVGTHVQLLNSFPFPYVKMPVDKRTGKYVDGMFWNLYETALRDGNDTSQWLEFLDFKSVEEVQENVEVAAPETFWGLAEWANIFTDLSTVRTLQPMIITYWR